MLDTINLNLKKIKMIIKENPYDENINKLKLEIYSMLLGYYSAQYDKDYFNVYNNGEKIIGLDSTIQNIIGLNHQLINLNENTLDSFKKLIFKSGNEQDKYHKIFKYFLDGYIFYQSSVERNDSIFDSFINSRKRLENKLCKVKCYVDPI